MKTDNRPSAVALLLQLADAESPVRSAVVGPSASPISLRRWANDYFEGRQRAEPDTNG